MKRMMAFVNEYVDWKNELIANIQEGVRLFTDKYEVPHIDLGEMDAKVLYERGTASEELRNENDTYIRYLTADSWSLEENIKPFWLRPPSYNDLEMEQLVEILGAVQKLLDMHKNEIAVSWEK